ncbi:hypothetical protein [Ramlibacter sp.]|uniref:hypothetical protein n=1 Tax=Ramlibacter sp. TaxID=1917967 RepID=UPI0017DC4AB9|nr:hypothetical protein [Ramlibacter sp.]MBA2672680.1 hypothetical protein [Ramlibacter sp.]
MPRLQRTQLVERLRHTPLRRVRGSSAVQRLGFDTEARMAVVQFRGNELLYGYPQLSDDEIQGLLRVMQDHGSIGEYVSKVIKANHDHEHVRSDERAEA